VTLGWRSSPADSQGSAGFVYKFKKVKSDIIVKVIKIFTDGASRGNPGPGGWGSIIVFPDGKTIMRNKELTRPNDWHRSVGRGIKNNEVIELGGREANTTNNRMELTAVIEALNFVNGKLKTKNEKIEILTDSSYVKKGAKNWLTEWKKNNWKTKQKRAVLNRDLWEKLDRLLQKASVSWHLLPGHSNIPANERCDEIATAFADLSAQAGGKKPKLYSGVLENYGIDLSVASMWPQAKSPLAGGPKTKSFRKPYSYVSEVKGIVKTHKTWAECEKRVKGVSGARFKKVFSGKEESELAKQWRVA
jgi:ribonuclease HI